MEIVRGASSSSSSMLSSMFSLRPRRDKHCVIQRIDNTPLYFDVTIKSIHGIEPFRPTSSGGGGMDSQCIYFAVLWLENPAAIGGNCTNEEARETHKTLADSSDINVRWWTPQKFEFRLDPAVFEWDKLKLEVVRIGFGDEIGTSGGKRIVGRASIQISKVIGGACKELKDYKVDLVKTRTTTKAGTGFECIREGKISMDMKLSREYRFNYQGPEYRFKST